jgi:hypothetical protein
VAERDAQAGMLAAVIANSQSAIFKDLDSRFLLVNHTLQNILGQTDDWVVVDSFQV